MTFTLMPGKAFKGTISSAYEEVVIALDVGAKDYFSLNVKAKNAWPMVSLETASGQTILEPSSFNSKKAKTSLVDPDLLDGQSLFARVSMQAGHTGKFKLKLAGQGDLEEIRDDVIKFTNKQRRKRGLDALEADKLLHQAAQGHVDDMEDVSQYLGHQSSDGRSLSDRIDEVGYQWRSIRENAASGQLSAKQVVKGWMNSPGHRANILSEDVTEIGIGFAVDDLTKETYWIQKFAAPM
tara:strand:- start:3944 stop:4657 length:714 start_codon:yes stop_codon:yes gene_type:complete